MTSTFPHELLFTIFSLLSLLLATVSPPLPPSETTAMKVQTTTTSTATHTTTVYQKPSTHTNPDITANDYEKTASSTTMDMLPWILMGTMTVLFLGLLTANVICCTVYALKQYNSKKKQYTLKRNPSYLPTSRPVNAHNCGFENHIYDVPTT